MQRGEMWGSNGVIMGEDDDGVMGRKGVTKEDGALYKGKIRTRGAAREEQKKKTRRRRDSSRCLNCSTRAGSGEESGVMSGVPEAE